MRRSPFLVTHDYRSVVDKQHRAGIGMGIVEGEIAAKGSLIPHANIGNLRFGVGQCRRMLAHKLAGFEGMVRHAGANPQHAVIQRDAMQPLDFFHIDQHFRLQHAVA